MATPYFYYPNAPVTAVARREIILVVDGQEPGTKVPCELTDRKVPLGDFEDGQTGEVRHTDFTRKGKPSPTRITPFTLPEPVLPEPGGEVGPDQPPTAGSGAPAGGTTTEPTGTEPVPTPEPAPTEPAPAAAPAAPAAPAPRKAAAGGTPAPAKAPAPAAQPAKGTT